MDAIIISGTGDLFAKGNVANVNVLLSFSNFIGDKDHLSLIKIKIVSLYSR